MKNGSEAYQRRIAHEWVFYPTLADEGKANIGSVIKIFVQIDVYKTVFCGMDPGVYCRAVFKLGLRQLIIERGSIQSRWICFILVAIFYGNSNMIKK